MEEELNAVAFGIDPPDWETGTVEDTIDDQFGWRQKERRKVQQIHYSGRLELVKKARTTMML